MKGSSFIYRASDHCSHQTKGGDEKEGKYEMCAKFQKIIP
jgi:hypothetical protein